MEFVRAFVVGGLICVIAQILIDKTKMSSGRILVLFVCLGCVLGGLGLYEPLVQYANAGATVPLPGFGYALAKGVMNEVDQFGIIGALNGGLKACATGITAAIIFAVAASLIFNAKEKS